MREERRRGRNGEEREVGKVRKRDRDRERDPRKVFTLF
jgi:hypothetical protein